MGSIWRRFEQACKQIKANMNVLEIQEKSAVQKADMRFEEQDEKIRKLNMEISLLKMRPASSGTTRGGPAPVLTSVQRRYGLSAARLNSKDGARF